MHETYVCWHLEHTIQTDAQIGSNTAALQSPNRLIWQVVLRSVKAVAAEMQTGMHPDDRCFCILWINKSCPCTYPIQHELESPVVMVLVAIMTFMSSSSLSASFASALAISSALLLVADSWVCFTWRSSIRGWSRSMGQMSSQLPRLCPSTSTSRTKPSCTFRTREFWRAVSDAPVLSHHAAATCSPIMLVQHHAAATLCWCNIMLVQHHAAVPLCCPSWCIMLVHM